MQNFRPLSQKFSEISRFEKFEFMRFCLTLTHRNCHNLLNFWDDISKSIADNRKKVEFEKIFGENLRNQVEIAKEFIKRMKIKS